jgi:hypothetical protein
MARISFKSLAEYLHLTQKEWTTESSRASEAELRYREEYTAGMACMDRGDYETAIPHLKKGVNSKRYKKDAYYALAECYRQLKMIPLARKTYERLMRFDYHYKDVQQKMQELDAPRPTFSAEAGQTASADQATIARPAEERYQLLNTLHEGAYTRIYKVRDSLLERTIALKQVDPGYPNRDAYLRQMKARAALDHPNILRIYDIDEQQGQIAMEYVEGRDLRATLQLKGALSHDMLIYIAVQLVNGLSRAHAAGIVHHALMPDHLLLTRQCALKIMAFRAPDSFLHLRKTDDPYKFRYVPPERFCRKQLTVASNVYSCGVIVYEMFTGQPPFMLETLGQIKMFLQSPETPPYDVTRLPPGIDPILKRCLTLSPDQRYPSIRAFGEALIRWHQQCKHANTHAENINTYKDFLLMAWADGRLTDEEATFLAHKREELAITEAEAQHTETEVKAELRALLRRSS